MNRLDGKIAVVTGDTQRLGAAIARQFAASGATGIVTCGRNADKGTAIAEAITRDTGVPVHFVVADLGNVFDCRTQLYKPTKLSEGLMYW
ncbi:MAG: SDR family NAD(P)-dependent oxidoreductase [Halocynthiibacter sp.]